MNTIEAAMKFIDAGVNVLPIQSNSKRPVGSTWQRITDNETAQAVFSDATLNIGIIYDDSLFVIDVEHNHGNVDGAATFKKWTTANPDMFPSTLIQKTVRGGLHIFYKIPHGLSLTHNGSFMHGIEIRTGNHYSVVAPSIINQQPYSFINENADIATAPIELIKYINQHQQVSQGDAQQSAFSSPNSTNKTALLFEQIANGLGLEGNRNNALASFVGGLLIRNIDAQTTYELAAIANERATPPLPDKEFNTTFKSILRREMNRRQQHG